MERREVHVILHKLTDDVTAFDVHTIGEEVHIEFFGRRGVASDVEIILPLEDAKVLAAKLVAAVRRVESERRRRTREYLFETLSYLPENLAWLLEGVG